MDKQPLLKSLIGFFRTSGYRMTSQDSDLGELPLDERKSTDTEYQEGPWSAATSSDTRSQTSWLKRIACVLGFGLYSFLLLRYAPRSFTDVECGKQVSLWSPLNKAIEYIEYDFELGFDHGNEYRGPPTPELEQAWDKLWRYDPVPFPVDKLPLVNRSETVLQGDKLAELENGAVAANFGVFHQIHCLNYLRQYTWRDWYFRHPEKVETPLDMLASDVGVRMHADHCIDALRLVLMCHGDTTPYFTIIDPSQPIGARGDFSAHRKCRNFERLQSWTEENSEKFQRWG